MAYIDSAREGKPLFCWNWDSLPLILTNYLLVPASHLGHPIVKRKRQMFLEEDIFNINFMMGSVSSRVSGFLHWPQEYLMAFKGTQITCEEAGVTTQIGFYK